MVRLRLVAVTAALIAPALLPAEAAAENGIKPRLPVEWNPPPTCLEFVDRSADPVYRFQYAIADEDPSPGEELLPDEVADSRRHQFFAMSRQGNPQTGFPYNWISPADVQAAVDKDLISDTTVAADETLDTSPLWTDRFVRITPDDERLPISNESVAAGVDWDTSDVPAGAYMIWGYTWEPAFNIWSQRIGNVVVVHDGDPDAVGPAAALVIEDIEDLVVYSDQAAILQGCVHALPGTTVTGYFSETPGNGAPDDWQPTWVPFAEDVAVDGDTFELEFVTGDGHATPSLLVQLVFTDPQGRSYEAHLPELISWLPGSEGGCDSDGGGFIGMPGCGGSGGEESSGGASETEGSGTTSAGTSQENTSSASDSATSGPSAGGDGGGSGGTCAVGSGSPTAVGGLMLLGLLGLRRRRSRSVLP